MLRTLVILTFVLCFPLHASSQSCNWEWIYPTPQGNELNAIWGSAPNNVYAVGEYGTVVHYDGTEWSIMSNVTSSELYGIWGSSESDIYAVGESKTIIHFDGSSWSVISYLFTYIGYFDIWGDSATDIFVVGYDGLVLHFDGLTWNELATGWPEDLLSVWGSSPSDIFAGSYDGSIVHFDGSLWSVMSTTIAASIKNIWGSSSTNVYACNSFILLHYDGTSWSGLAAPRNIVDVWGTSSSNIYMAKEDGVVFHSDGSSLTTSYHHGAFTPYFESILGFPTGDVFVIGHNGYTMRYDGSTWTSHSTEGGFFKAVRIWGASDNNFYLLDYLGNHLHYDGFTFNEINTSELVTPYDCWGNAMDDVYTAGGRYHTFEGLIEHFDGLTWSTLYVSPDEIYGVWSSAFNNIYAVNKKGRIVHFDGVTWDEISTGVLTPLRAIRGYSPTNIYAAGDNKAILHFDGSSWSRIHTPVSVDLNRITVSSPTDVFFTGNGYGSHTGAWLFHYDGSTLTALLWRSGTFTDIWSSSPSNVYVVGMEDSTYTGSVLHYDGTTISEITAFNTSEFHAVWGFAEHTIIVSNEEGLLKYSCPVIPESTLLGSVVLIVLLVLAIMTCSTQDRSAI